MTVIIPARYHSSRFPGKPLAMLSGMPVVQRTYLNAASVADSVYVTTDDTRIADAVAAFGGNVVMTPRELATGTERVRAAIGILGVTDDVVVNVQGDEPLLAPADIARAAACLDDPRADIATLIYPFDISRGYAELADPGTPKVVTDNDGYALYFSRAVIPHVRGAEPGKLPPGATYYTHIGIYAFRTAALRHTATLPPSPLEQAENLEQLRWLAAGMRIKTAVASAPSVGIDTPADLEKAQSIISSRE